jgi:hypothetical protein
MGMSIMWETQVGAVFSHFRRRRKCGLANIGVSDQVDVHIEYRSKPMPRTLVSQAGGELMLGCKAAEATVEDGGVDQVVESKSHHELAGFL